MKKALAGPAKRTAKKKPERRAMIAAKRRRNRDPGAVLAYVTQKAPRGADAWANGVLVRAWAPLVRLSRSLRTAAARIARQLRPLGVLLFRLLGRFERLLLRLAAWSRRAATWASGKLTPWRAICLAILAAAGCLLAAQFVDYRAVEVGQPGYAGLPAASAPTVGGETAGQAHAYLLVPVALLAAALALAALRNERRRGLGRVVFALGLLSLGVALLVDLPAGRDVGAEASRFAGAKAVLDDGFYAEIAAATGLMLGGMLLAGAHKVRERHGYRPRKPSLARNSRFAFARRLRRGSARRRARTSSA